MSYLCISLVNTDTSTTVHLHTIISLKTVLVCILKYLTLPELVDGFALLAQWGDQDFDISKKKKNAAPCITILSTLSAASNTSVALEVTMADTWRSSIHSSSNTSSVASWIISLSSGCLL